METSIGETLREARNRRKLEISEVEAAIKIRARYLRAMENDEWGVLPGGAYTRGFIRTYASHLGLDGERLADEYRQVAGTPVVEGVPLQPVRRPSRGPSTWFPSWVWVAAVSVLLVAIMVGVGLAVDGDNGSQQSERSARATDGGQAEGDAPRLVTTPGVELEVEATGEVWACLLDADRKELIDGSILAPGEVEGPFRSDGYTAAFGNGDVTLVIDGEAAETPPSSSPIGYEIDGEGRLRELEEGQRPDCE